MAKKKTGEMQEVEVEEKTSKISINTIDHTWGDVLQYLREGKEISFEAEPDRILPDPPSQSIFLELPKKYQLQWIQAKEIKGYLEETFEDREWLDGVQVSLSPTTFQERFDVKDGKDDKVYYWARPEQETKLGLTGWKKVNDKKLKTFGKEKSGEHRLKVGGNVLHVLLEKDKELDTAQKRQRSLERQVRIHGKNNVGDAPELMTQAQLEKKVKIEG